MMELYADNAAAAPCDPELLEYFTACAKDFPGNQESMGFHGDLAARRIREGAEELLAAFRLHSHVPVFGNAGTDALALGVETLCRSVKPGMEILTTTLEHPALEWALKRSCTRHGLSIRQCPADRSGVRLDQFETMLSERTAAVAVHHVQSETGGILDLTKIRSLLDRLAPQAILLADTMQSVGKIPLEIERVRPDFLTFSGQKLGAPGGAVLFCAGKYAKTARALRSVEHFGSRCSVPLALTAIRCGIRAMESQPTSYAHAVRLRESLREALRRNDVPCTLTLPAEAASPFIVHLLTAPYQGAILTRALHLRRISVAPGSACESETPGGSRVLNAMGFSRRDSFCGLRISCWKTNTVEEMSLLAENLADCIRSY